MVKIKAKSLCLGGVFFRKEIICAIYEKKNVRVSDGGKKNKKVFLYKFDNVGKKFDKKNIICAVYDISLKC